MLKGIVDHLIEDVLPRYKSGEMILEHDLRRVKMLLRKGTDEEKQTLESAFADTELLRLMKEEIAQPQCDEVCIFSKYKTEEIFTLS